MFINKPITESDFGLFSESKILLLKKSRNKCGVGRTMNNNTDYAKALIVRSKDRLPNLK